MCLRKEYKVIILEERELGKERRKTRGEKMRGRRQFEDNTYRS